MNRLIRSLPAAFFLFASFLWGQTSTGIYGAGVHGRVVDPDGRAVPHATVRLYSQNGTAVTTQSDAAGRYRLAGLAPGAYLLEAAGPASALTASEELRVPPHTNLQYNIELEIQSLRTEVLVTASSTPVPLDAVAKAIDTVDRDQLGRRMEFSVAEALRNVPGLRVRQQLGPGSFTTIQTRGLRNQDTALLVDGLRFRDAAGTAGDATAFYEDMTLVDTDRLEILRGSGSSLYGSNAIGGVINVVGMQGGEKTHGEVSVEGGGLGMIRSVGRLSGGLGGRDRFTYSTGVAHLNVTQGLDGSDPYRNTSVQGFAKYDFTPTLSLSGRIWGGNSFVALNESPAFTAEVLANHPASGIIPAVGLPTRERIRFENGESFTVGSATFISAFDDPDNRRDASFFSGAVIFNHSLSPSSSYRLSYHAVDTNRTFRDGPGGVGAFEPAFPNLSRFDGRIGTLQARTDHRVGEYNLVTFGYEYEREEFLSRTREQTADQAPELSSTNQIRQGSHSLFFQDQIRLADRRLQIVVSGRMQSFHLETPTFSGELNPYRGVEFDSPKTAYTGDLAVAYLIRSSGTKLRAHGGNAYRAPSAFNRFGGFFSSFSGSFSFLGDPRLSPERSLAFDAGIDQWLFNSKIRLSSTFFYTNIQETIVFDFGVINPLTDPFGRFGGYRNSGGGLARGAEFSLSATPNLFARIIASYTYTNSDSRNPTVPGEDYFKVLGLSDHMFTLTVLQRVGRHIDMAFDLFAVSDYSQRLFGAPGRFVFDGPVKADVVAGYTVPLREGTNLKFYAKIENAFGRKYFEDGFGAPGLWGTGGVKFNF